MKKKALLVLTVVVTICITGGIYVYNVVQAKNINVIDYREPEEINENGYQITKYENVDAVEWIDEDNVLVLKDNGEYHNPDADISMSYISIYNLNTKTCKDYKDVNMDSNDMHGVSPDGRYVLYGEPRNIPEIESDEWNKAAESKELFHEKIDILDLSTGDIIEDFSKVTNNCSAEFKWISNDKIFINYGGEWDVFNIYGKLIKHGTFSFENSDSDYVMLTGVNDINDLGDDIDGEFYYTKDFMGSDGNLGITIYSMDVNTLKEEQVYKSEHSFETSKAGKIIVMDDFNNNGQANEDGVFVNRTFGFKIINDNGELIKNIESDSGRLSRNFKLSQSGDKGVFVDTVSKIKHEDNNTLSDCIKEVDIKSGKINELARIENLIDTSNEEEFYNAGQIVTEEGTKMRKVPGPRFINISWERNGNSLLFTYEYTSKKDGQNHTDTYVVTFDD